MQKYYIYGKYISNIEILKSKFIGIFQPVENPDSVEEILKSIKKEYPKARHYIYAYIINDKQKSCDDGEPSGTAGKPILELLNKYNFQNVLLVVVRYFGGTKLGASRLLRTYLDSAKQAVESAEKYTVANRNIYSITIESKKRSSFEEFCKNNEITIDKIMYYNECINVEVSSMFNIEDILKTFPNEEMEYLGFSEVRKKV